MIFRIPIISSRNGVYSHRNENLRYNLLIVGGLDKVQPRPQ